MSETLKVCKIIRRPEGRAILECDTHTFLDQIGVKHLHPYDQDITNILDGVEDDVSEKDRQRIIDDEYKKFANNVESCIRTFLISHPINGVNDVHIDWGKDKVRIDIGDKEKFLSSIRNSMNGAGPFWADSNKQLIECAGGGIDDTIRTHFGWLSYVPEVYGTQSIQGCVESD